MIVDAQTVSLLRILENCQSSKPQDLGCKVQWNAEFRVTPERQMTSAKYLLRKDLPDPPRVRHMTKTTPNPKS